MPELPDVEVFRKYTEKHALKKEIASVKINSEKILEGKADKIKKALQGESFNDTDRVGKQMFIKFANDQWLRMHFGMTAYPYFFEDKEEEPEHSQLLVEYSNGGFFSFVCSRKFGEIELVKSVEAFVEDNGLGKDALKLSKDDFREILEGKSGKIKSTLMNQSNIAGIGNIYSDEILYQSKIHPEKKTKELSKDEVQEIYRVMQRVLKTAVNNEADPSKLPNDYLIPNREDGKDCPKCDGKIKKTDISGRGCYLCESCQKL